LGIAAIFSGGKLARAFRRRFARQGWDEIQDIEYFVPRKGQAPSELFALPIAKNLEGLFFDIHSAMRDLDGLHADEALEELCKIIYTRSYEEESTKGNGTFGLASHNFGTNEEFAAAVREFYTAAAAYDLRVFRLKIPQYERSRGVFNQPLRLSSVALTKCYRMLETYDLSNSQTDVKGRAFQKVLGKAVRSGMGQYFTPNQICELMADIVGPKVSDLILDPFCGSGHFLTESLKQVALKEGNQSKAFHEFAFGKLHGIEKSERMVRIAMTDMRLNGDGHSNIRCTDALLEFANYPDISPDSFDVVITNPPFGSLLGQDAISALGAFELTKNRKGSPLEIIGLERAVQFLRPGGRLAILLPDSIFSADSTQWVRTWLLDNVVPRVIVSLPNETFAPFGANVKTSILFGRKLQVGETRHAKHKVNMIQATNVGYDASGREQAGSDLEHVAKTAKEFLKQEGW
jgi:type I restriction enzyme M protein